MKKTISLLLVLVMCISLCACGEVETNDEGFIINLGRALDARWKLSNQETPDNVSYKDYLKTVVNAELEVLGSYSDYTFTDSKLAAYAEQYFAALDKQMEGVSYYGVDDTLYEKVFTSQGYNQRAKIMYHIYNEYGLTVNEKNTSTLQEFLTLGEKVIAIENLTTQPLTLENKGNECEIILENTSKFDLSGIQITVNFLDDADIVVYSNPAYMEDWPSGSKNRVTVWTDQVQFSRAELCIEDYMNSIVTNYVPVEYVNEMIINITPVDLPKEVSNGYDNCVQSSCIVNDFSYEVGYWNNGKAGVTLHFAGIKTFDADGEDANGYCNFVYKILAEDGTVTDSGTIYLDALKSNETFRDAAGYTNELAPGDYTIIVEDDMF